MIKYGKCEFEENHDCEFLMKNGIYSEKYEVSFCAFQIKQTNASRIRKMSDAELANFLYFFDCEELYNENEIVDWLQLESEE